MLCFALSGYSLSANVMETLVKKGMKIEEIKKAASGLKVSDRLFCYSTLIRNTQESIRTFLNWWMQNVWMIIWKLWQMKWM